MPRIARKRSSSGYYHVVLRGINKQTLFYDDEDCEVFLNRLKLAQQKVDFQLIAFCLMPNHVHLLIKEEGSLSDVMAIALSSYVYWYNSKYERVGHLFQNRYKSEPIETDEYLLCCVRYILQNPVKANLCDSIWNYKWSSASVFVKQQKSMVDANIIKDMLRGNVYSFLEEKSSDKFLEWESTVKYTDEKMLQIVNKVLNNQNIYDIMKLSKSERNKYLELILSIDGMGLRQASRITGVSVAILRNLK